jgi:hypothetical protein
MGAAQGRGSSTAAGGRPRRAGHARPRVGAAPGRELARADRKPRPTASRPAMPCGCAAARGRARRGRAHGPGAGHRAAGAGVRGNEVLPLQTLEIKENEEQEWRSSPGKKTLAGAEVKSVNCRRFRGPIDEPNTLRRSLRRDERNDTLRFGRRCTDWE